jgi:hypothetical protein
MFDETLHEQEELVGSLTSLRQAMGESITLLEIREQLRAWRAHAITEAQQRSTLGNWGAACDESLALLKNEQALWDATLKITGGLPELTSVVAHVRSALKDIQTVMRIAEQRLRTILELQARMSKQALAIADNIEALNASRQRLEAGLLHQDAPPIWQRTPARQTEKMTSVLGRSLEQAYASSAGFVAANQGLISCAVFFLALACVIIRQFRRAVLKAAALDGGSALAARVLKRPLSLALLFASPVTFMLAPVSRLRVVFFLTLLFLIPITRLLPFYTSGMRLIYFLASFYALNGLIGILDVGAATKRELIAGLFAVSLGILAWWGRPARFHTTDAYEAAWKREIFFIRLSLVLLAPVLIFDVFGFLLLSDLLRLLVLLCSSCGLILYVLVKVTTTLLAALLRLPQMRSFASVRMYDVALVKWTGSVLRLSAILCWLYITVHIIDADHAVLGGLAAVLNARVGVKAFSFSLGDVLGFLCVLTVGYLIASALRFILREEILPYWRLSRGVPETISTSVYYVLLLLVFFSSLSAAGIQLDKLTVLTGALASALASACRMS